MGKRKKYISPIVETIEVSPQLLQNASYTEPNANVVIPTVVIDIEVFDDTEINPVLAL